MKVSYSSMTIKPIARFLCSSRAKSLTLQQIFKVFVVIKDEKAKLLYIF